MTNLRLNQLRTKIVKFDYKVEHHSVAAPKTIVIDSLMSKTSSYETIIKYWRGIDSENNELDQTEAFEHWCKQLEEVTIDPEKEFDDSIGLFETCGGRYFLPWKHVLVEFMDAIKDYQEHQRELNCISAISKESAKRLLWLVPVLANYKSRIYIDTNNGCFNVDFSTRDNGVLSAQVAESGQVHYSYVAQNKKIFKITGTAKFKDPRDYIKFNKVLKML